MNQAAVQRIISEANSACRRAATMFDLGFARGLLAALQRLDHISKSELDARYKDAYAHAAPHLRSRMSALARRNRASLGKGVIVPAAPKTRRNRGT